MSMFIGKTNQAQSESILHITNGITPLATMKSGAVLATTQFHSSLPYLEIQEYKMIRVNATTLQAPIEFINAYSNHYPYFISVDGVLQNFAMDLFMYRWNSSSSAGSATSNYPTNTYKYIRKQSSTDNNYIYIIKNIYMRNYQPFTPINNEIKVTGDTFIVRGKDIYNTRYLQNGVLNTVDAKFYADQKTPTAGRELQVVNSLVTGNMGIYSNPGESAILKGEHKVFSSLYNTKSKYKEKTPAVIPGAYNITPQWFYGCGSNGTLVSPKVRVGVQASGFSDGDMFLLDWVPQNTEIYDMGLYKFKQGYIGTPSYWSHAELRYGVDRCEGMVTCCYRGSSDCWQATDCFDCYMENNAHCDIKSLACEDYPVTYYDVTAEWILEGEGSDVILYHQATYNISSDNCLCGCETWSSGIQFWYESRLATIKFY